MWCLKAGHFLQRSIKKLTVAQSRSAHVIADGRGHCNELFNSCYKVKLANSQFEIPYEKLDKTTMMKYKFPTFTLKYSSEDCVQHALSVGIDKSHPNAKKLLSKDSNLEVLPSFLLPFANNIMLQFGLELLYADRSVHGEQFITLYQPLKPEDEISYNLEVVDVVDKAKGTLYILNFHGSDEMGNEIFLLECQIFEIGTKDIGRKYTKFQSKKIISPPNREPDQTFLFKTVELSSEFFHPTSTDIEKSIFSVNHFKQHYGITEKFSTRPNCHGRYYLGAVIQQILKFYTNGNTKLFKSVKTRFSNPVYPGNTLMTKSWKIDDLIHFETFSNESGKRVLEGAYLELMK